MSKQAIKKMLTEKFGAIHVACLGQWGFDSTLWVIRGWVAGASYPWSDEVIVKANGEVYSRP